jgi:putative tryptophan/tyrosine transport system substrate-binding protein
MTPCIGRRDFITLLGGAAAWPLAARAQKPERMRRIGVLMPGVATEPDRQGWAAAFVQTLHNLGWEEGKNIRIETRWNASDAERARTYAVELVKLGPDVILASTTGNLEPLLRATRTIPIVFTQVSDPVAQGFVPDLAHPSGNITGFAGFEFSMGGKWLELLKQAVPSLTRVAVMSNPKTSPQSVLFLRSIKAAAPSFGVQIIDAPVHDRADITRAIESLSLEPKAGLLITTDSFVISHRDLIAELVNQHRLPSIASDLIFVRRGGLMYYGLDQEDQFRQAAIYVDRILKGAKPGDLPVQLPTKFAFIINVKAAHTLGIDLPMGLMLRADEVIE